jgi:quinol-cytochrome oxidoreductase complex cytochrome b subunit
VNSAGIRQCACGYQFTGESPPRGSEPVDDEKVRKRRFAFGFGMIGFAIAIVMGWNATMNPTSDGRFLNTAPTLGIDITLVIGVVGFLYCLVNFLRS